MALTATAVKQAQPAEKPQKLFDGGGLFLFVTPEGGKYWRLKYRFGGREKKLALGVYPEVTLETARERRDEARTLLTEGIDPGEIRKQQRAFEQDEASRLEAPMCFAVDSDGALSIRLGARRVNLTPSETAQLRAFLHATREVLPKE